MIYRLQGDVVGIYNTSGTKVVGYAYDAFGNCTTTLGANNEFSKINHFRYRGYYLDRETNLYYLNSRYYNPEWRRFISPANVSALDPQAVNGLNLYVYAGNEPISFSFSHFGFGRSTGVSDRMMNSISSANSTKPMSNGKFSFGQLADGLDTGSTLHGLYTSISGIVNHTAYFSKNLYAFSDDMTMIGASMKDGVLAFNQFTWKFGKGDIISVALGVGLDAYDSIQRGVSPGGVLLGATLTAAEGAVLIYLNKGILYGLTAFGSTICPTIGTVVGFAIGAVICIVVDVLVSNQLDYLIDEIAK